MAIDHFHKWRPLLRSFVFMLIRPTALVLKQIFFWNLLVVARLVRLISIRTKEYSIWPPLWKRSILIPWDTRNYLHKNRDRFPLFCSTNRPSWCHHLLHAASEPYFKGVLSRQSCCFLAQNTYKSFFLILTRAENTSLRFRNTSIINTSIFFFARTVIHGTFFAFPRRSVRELWKLRLNSVFQNPIKCHPQQHREINILSAVILLVFHKQTSSLFLSFHWCEDSCQHSKVEQNSVTESFQTLPCVNLKFRDWTRTSMR